MAHLYYILPHFVIFVAYMSDNIQGHFFAGQPLFRTLMKKLKKKKAIPDHCAKYVSGCPQVWQTISQQSRETDAEA